MTCSVCGEPLQMTPWGPVGERGPCRDPLDPNQEDLGQHVAEGAS